MKAGNKLKAFSVLSIALLGMGNFSSFAQEVELKGEIKCGPSNNGGQGYSQPLNIRLINGYGTGITESTDTLENQEVLISADGAINYSAIGIWKNQPNRRWRIYGIGTLNGLAIQASGSMYGNTASELVRTKCDISLKSIAPIIAPETRDTSYKIETIGPPLGVSPSTIDGGARFREWGLEKGLPWSLRVKPANNSKEIKSRSPSFTEKLIFAEASNVLMQTKAKVIIFIDDGKVVSAQVRPHIKGETLLPSASMSKSVTALAVGKAICEDKLTLDTTAHSLINSLQGTAIGKATLRDILLMSSGSAETSTEHTHGITVDETRQYLWNPNGSVKDLVSSPRISSSKSGRATYDYKSTDPYIAALMVQQATGTPFTEWLGDKIFKEAGITDNYALDTDRQGNFLATGGVRLSMNDWIRLAIYIQEQRDQETCFGKFVQGLSTSQIKISKQAGVNGYFNGYSYFTWTENEQVANSAWVAGHHGQRIGWSTKKNNKKVFLTFGDGSDSEMSRIYPIANRWIN